MTEEKVPWWRWAFELALGGIRSGLGLFRRNGKVESGAEPGREDGSVGSVNEIDALKGHDFSRAVNGTERRGPLGPEGCCSGVFRGLRVFPLLQKLPLRPHLSITPADGRMQRAKPLGLTSTKTKRLR